MRTRRIAWAWRGPLAAPSAVPLAALLLAAMLVLVGCSAGSGPGIATAGGGAQTGPSVDPREQGRLLAACLRENGVDAQDPPDGTGPKVGLPSTIDKSKLAAAMERCRRYAPDAGLGKRIDPADIEMLRQHARCLREQGFPDWPDPDPDTGASKWDDPAKARAAKNDLRFRGALEACRRFDVLPGLDLR